MEALLAILTGGLFAGGFYLVLHRNVIKMAFGIVLLGHASNLLLFTAAGLVRSRSPVIPAGRESPSFPMADPLPQALILTSIVISFGLVAFAVVLFLRAFRQVKSEDVENAAGEEE